MDPYKLYLNLIFEPISWQHYYEIWGQINDVYLL